MIILDDGTKIRSKSVVITTGTFLKGQINIGLNVFPAGRIGDQPAIGKTVSFCKDESNYHIVGLANTLESLNLKMGRLKTGTPPRLNADTINFKVCNQQKGDDPPQPFSFMNDKVWIKAEDQLLCYLTKTTTAIEDIVKNNLHVNRHVTEEVNGPR